MTPFDPPEPFVSWESYAKYLHGAIEKLAEDYDKRVTISIGSGAIVGLDSNQEVARRLREILRGGEKPSARR